MIFFSFQKKNKYYQKYYWVCVCVFFFVARKYQKKYYQKQYQVCAFVFVLLLGNIRKINQKKYYQKQYCMCVCVFLLLGNIGKMNQKKLGISTETQPYEPKLQNPQKGLLLGNQMVDKSFERTSVAVLNRTGKDFPQSSHKKPICHHQFQLTMFFWRSTHPPLVCSSIKMMAQ